MKGYLLLFLLASATYLAAQNDITRLLPGDKQFGYWIIRDTARVYSNDQLFNYINGGADIYQEYGFSEVISSYYVNPSGVSIHVEIYRMTDNDAAFGIFSLNSTGNGAAVSIGDQAYQYDQYLDVWQDSWFIRIASTLAGKTMTDTVQIFAREICRQLDKKGFPPRLTEVLPGADLVPGQVKFLRGQIALNNVFNFGHGSVAGFQEGAVLRTQDYSAFVFLYPDDYRRREWFASARGKMQSSKKFHQFETREDGFLVRDKSGRPLEFKPYKKMMLIIDGLEWENAATLFNEMSEKIDQYYP